MVGRDAIDRSPPGRPVSGRHAARLARIPEKTARVALNDLSELGIITRRESTGQYLFSANREHVLWESLKNLFDAERTRSAMLRSELETAAIHDDSRLVSLLIFGSAARGEDRLGSDLDLLAIVNNDESAEPLRDRITDLIPHFETRFGVRLSPIILTVEQFRERHTGGDPFAAEVIRDAEIIAGQDPSEVIRG